MPAAYAALSEVGIVRPDVDVVARPIDELMNAWATLNVDTYQAQWHPEAAQSFGGEEELGLGEILARRRNDFQRLLAVRVNDYRRCVVTSGENGEITLLVTYDMTMYWPDEDGVRTRRDVEEELFVVRFNSQVRRYQISRNTDSDLRGAPVCTTEPPDPDRRGGWLPWLLG